ncbi:FAR1 Related Sequences transcription factor family [Prunus dulcis]|uniref:FAR1 Related Sequences transcription factor family n=1 Tax=Prunus dulcis TaxID=3755 RepID=A0A5H2Y9H2_PRUDU|nr:FAR1 Related Sequences transcription factor family [Prunus dulcis]
MWLIEESSRSHSNLEISEENDEFEIGETRLENTMNPEETTQEPKKRSSKKGDCGELKYVTLSCSRSRIPQSTASNVLKPYPSIKCNCKAQLRVVEAGGLENVPFMEKYGRNYTNKVRRLQLREGVAIAIQKYFFKMQAQNANFFYAIDLDESGRLRNVFWADFRSVNHHRHSILLGSGLISNEDTETFVWLFKVWLACMSGHAPCGIITNQDRAMKNAIEIVFPNTRHRWCLWHIMKKLHEKLKSYKHYESIKFALENIVYDSLTNIEFEDRCKEMIERYELQNND